MPPARYPATAFTVPTGGSLDARVRVLSEAVSRKADQTSEPVYSAVLLQAPGGAVWRVSVTDAGNLVADVVTRG